MGKAKRGAAPSSGASNHQELSTALGEIRLLIEHRSKEEDVQKRAFDQLYEELSQ